MLAVSHCAEVTCEGDFVLRNEAIVVSDDSQSMQGEAAAEPAETVENAMQSKVSATKNAAHEGSEDIRARPKATTSAGKRWRAECRARAT